MSKSQTRVLFNFVRKSLYENGQFFLSMLYIFSDIVASIGPVSAAPMLGFGDIPTAPAVSLIDFHGLNDDTIPYDVDHAAGEQSQERIQVVRKPSRI